MNWRWCEFDLLTAINSFIVCFAFHCFFIVNIHLMSFVYVTFMRILFSTTECNCSGLADECMFDVEQYRSTGSGGRCVGCRGNTAGPHCERCKEKFYRSSPQQPCQDCSCNAMGESNTHNPPIVLLAPIYYVFIHAIFLKCPESHTVIFIQIQIYANI